MMGETRTEEYTGNRIHLWSSRDVVIENNHVRGHRDGIYFEAARNTVARGNVREHNLRYGLQ
jgi:nitrous oxidase accessory protein